MPETPSTQEAIRGEEQPQAPSGKTRRRSREVANGAAGAEAGEAGEAEHAAAAAPRELSLDEAVCVVQRVWKGRKRRAIMSRWKEAVQALRDSYMDAKAMAAGAQSSPLYSDASLAARDALRRTPEVEAALDAAWDACRVCAGRPSATGLTKDEYQMMSRKLCKHAQTLPVSMRSRWSASRSAVSLML